jgi:hypothetical protein
MSATLKLTRGWIGIYSHHPFEITLDGTVIGTVPRQQTVELPIEHGHHTLRLRAGRQISPERALDATDGQTVTFSCHGAAIWPIYLASFLRPDLGITLKRE